MIRQQISLTNRLTSPPPSLTNGGNNAQVPNTADLRVDQVRRLDIHKNGPVSVTKLTLGLRVGFISYYLTENKLFTINPRVITGPPKLSLLLGAKSMPALIINPRLMTWMYLVGTLRQTSRDRCSFNTST